MYRVLAIPWGKSRRIRNLARVATVLSAALIVPLVLNAGPIIGTLDLSSHGTEVIAVNGTDIDFDYGGGVTTGFPPIATGPVTGSGDTALFDITAASTDSFSGLVGDTVTVADLNSTQQPVGTTVGPGYPLNFIQLPNGWIITLTEIYGGVDGTAGCSSTAAGGICTPAGSPFNLQNEAGNQVLVGFAFTGTISDGLGDTSYMNGTFSTTLSSTNINAILTDLDAGEAIVSAATGSIAVSPVPEPSSIVMILLGGVLTTSSVIGRRVRRR